MLYKRPWAVIWISRSFLALGCLAPSRANAAVKPVDAVLLRSAEDVKIRHAGTDTFASAGPGAELLSGETLRTGSAPALMLGCRAEGSETAIYELPAGLEITLATGIPAEALHTISQSMPCVLPLDDRLIGISVDDPRIRTLSGTWRDRLELLSSGGKLKLLSLLDPLEAVLAANPLDLASLIARAVHLEAAGLAADATRGYAEIYKAFEAAAWAGRSASRMAAQILPERDLNSAVVPPSLANPALRPRSTKGEGATSSTGPIAPRGDVYALLIGIGEYPKSVGVENLQYAEKDAELFADYLASNRGGKVKNIEIVRSANGTVAHIQAALERLVAGHASSNNTLILYVAAHGYYGCVDERGVPLPPGCLDQNSEPFILTTDASAEANRFTGLPMRAFNSLIAENAYRFGRVLVYVDVCHSGVIPWVRGRTSPPPDAVRMNFQPKEGTVGLMMASSRDKSNHENEYAYESDELKHGIFTYYVVSGLAGAAPATGNVVLFADLFDHVKDKVTQVTSDQVPFAESESNRLAVVDDAKQEPFQVPPSAGKPTKRKRSVDRSVSPLPVSMPVTPAVAGPNHERRRLEDEGQQILLQYLQGDQVPQKVESFTRCKQLFRDALSLAPAAIADESRMLFCEGRELTFLGQYDDARRKLERSIRLDPVHGYAYNALGIAFLQQLTSHPEYLQPAIDAFEDARKLEPMWAYPIHNLALVHAALGDTEQAVHAYHDAISIAPAYSYLPYNLGLLYQRMGRADLAEQVFRLAVKRAEARAARLGVPKEGWTEKAGPLNALGTVYLAEGRRSAAVKSFEAALKTNSRYVPAIHNLAIVRQRQGNTDKAVELWRSAIDIDPSFVAARLSLAEALEKRGNYADAIPQYRAVLERTPRYRVAHHALGRALVSQRDYTAALAEYELALAESSFDRAAIQERDDVRKLIAGQPPVTAAIRRLVSGGAR